MGGRNLLIFVKAHLSQILEISSATDHAIIYDGALPMDSTKVKDFWTGLFLFIFALLLYFYLTPNYVTEGSAIGLSPRFFPSLSAIVLGVLSALLMGYSFLHIRSNGTKLNPIGRGRPHSLFTSFVRPRTLLVVLILPIFFLLFEHFGFFMASPLTMVALMLAFGQRGKIIIISTSLLLTITLYCLFTYGLKVPLS